MAGPGGKLRASKPPFYRTVFVRHPVNPWTPLPAARVEALRRLEPCVVMGRGHSGTRIVAWMCHHLGWNMGADPDRVPSGDPVDRSFKQHMRVVATHSLDVRGPRDLRYRDRNRFRKAVHGFHRRIGAPSGRWGWKFPEAYLIGPYIEDAFPRARYIHLLRDGRDVAFKRHLTDVAEHRLARAILRRQQALGLPHHLQAALSWALQVELFQAFERQLPPGKVLTLRYEEVANAPLESADRICRFLGVPMTRDCEAYIARDVTAIHVAQHRSQDPRRVEEIEARIGPTLRQLQYL